ncbi:hypothetical protein roselon_00544 [Roseibacterium elongatum DSM 19469]|uniref:Uncharacterized protein n=1 Tax=Roseicyclus elongatus DSM 19469 TaxID=1294273 RepID=W8RPB8_9RHOB|nr:hypothetical protein roselon_00544 [Roseibacterium elongatum DSM 19469]
MATSTPGSGMVMTISGAGCAISMNTVAGCSRTVICAAYSVTSTEG